MVLRSLLGIVPTAARRCGGSSYTSTFSGDGFLLQHCCTRRALLLQWGKGRRQKDQRAEVVSRGLRDVESRLKIVYSNCVVNTFAILYIYYILSIFLCVAVSKELKFQFVEHVSPSSVPIPRRNGGLCGRWFQSCCGVG